VAEQRGDGLEAHSAVDRLGGQGVPEAVRVDAGDVGRAGDADYECLANIDSPATLKCRSSGSGGRRMCLSRLEKSSCGPGWSGVSLPDREKADPGGNSLIAITLLTVGGYKSRMSSSSLAPSLRRRISLPSARRRSMNS
jgi:hypothetical protein